MLTVLLFETAPPLVTAPVVVKAPTTVDDACERNPPTNVERLDTASELLADTAPEDVKAPTTVDEACETYPCTVSKPAVENDDVALPPK